MLAVDTNVLVYAADADPQFHAPCRTWLERLRARPDAWYTTWGILYEFLRVTTHPRVMRRPWTDNHRILKVWGAACGITLKRQRHRFKNTAAIDIDAHSCAGPAP